MNTRRASVTRKTKETDISATVGLDGSGQCEVDTGNGMLDHLLAQISRHGLIDLTVKAKGDVDTGWHHLVEDTAIVMGRAFGEALGEGAGIVRMAHALVPMDDALAQVAVDLSGRAHASVDISLTGEMVGTLPGDLVRHFLESFALGARISLHARLLSGTNPHHKAEAVFKALARALRQASELDPRRQGEIPSTKGTISG